MIAKGRARAELEAGKGGRGELTLDVSDVDDLRQNTLRVSETGKRGKKESD